MDGRFREAQMPGGTALVRTKPGTGAYIPDPDYLVTLNADSVLVRHALEPGGHGALAGTGADDRHRGQLK